MEILWIIEGRNVCLSFNDVTRKIPNSNVAYLFLFSEKMFTFFFFYQKVEQNVQKIFLRVVELKLRRNSAWKSGKNSRYTYLWNRAKMLDAVTSREHPPDELLCKNRDVFRVYILIHNSYRMYSSTHEKKIKTERERERKECVTERLSRCRNACAQLCLTGVDWTVPRAPSRSRSLVSLPLTPLVSFASSHHFFSFCLLLFLLYFRSSFIFTDYTWYYMIFAIYLLAYLYRVWSIWKKKFY